MGDEMMVKNARILLVVAVVMVAAAGFFPGPAFAGPTPRITALKAQAGAGGPVIHVTVTGTPDTVHYSPQPGVWVVEMPEVTWEPSAATVSAPALGIDRAEITSAEEFGDHKVTRLTVWLDRPAQAELATVPDGFELRFEFFGADSVPSPAVSHSDAAAANAVKAKPAVDPKQAKLPEETSGPTAVAQTKEPEKVVSDNLDPQKAQSSTKPDVVTPEVRMAGGALLAVDPVAGPDGVTIHLRSNGSLQAKTFTLPSPARIVVDLPGVIDRVNRNVFSVHSGPALRVRVAQHRVEPDAVTRLVVDLESPTDYSFTPTADGAVLRVGSAPAPVDQTSASGS
ncbi:MAG TPA: AMIN domain-containing protein, partial [Acidobacteria bacterium]|nr:AMIN domain-containing protein [Acidobacteriota bacterium]